MAGFQDGVPEAKLMAHFDAFLSSPGVKTRPRETSVNPGNGDLTNQVAGILKYI